MGWWELDDKGETNGKVEERISERKVGKGGSKDSKNKGIKRR